MWFFARVLYIKPAEKTSFMILDAGMTELIRPALYRSTILFKTSSKRAQKSMTWWDLYVKHQMLLLEVFLCLKRKEEICLPFVRPVLMAKQWLVSIIYVMHPCIFSDIN